MARATLVYIVWFLILALSLVTFLVWRTLVHDAQPVLRVSFLDIGQGDAILIESPSGRRMLVDGGPDGSVLRALGEVLPWYTRTIDVVLATHPDADHIGGLSDVLRQYHVSYIIDNSVSHDTPAVESFLKASAREDALVRGLTRGERINLGEGVIVEVLFPDRVLKEADTNLSSIVLRVSYGAHSFLLTGDAPESIERYLVSLDGKALESTVLKAGHHGSHTSSNVSFISAVSPEYVVYSRGCGNTYGHPHKEVVERFESFGVRAYDTCTEGTVTFETNGETLIIK